MTYLDKEHLVYKLMIRQLEFVTEELFAYALQSVKGKKKNDLLDAAQFESVEEGLCVQSMHIGSYDDEPRTFQMMEEFCRQNDLKRIEKTHKEIYILDSRKTPAEKLKTVLRFKVR